MHRREREVARRISQPVCIERLAEDRSPLEQARGCVGVEPQRHPRPRVDHLYDPAVVRLRHLAVLDGRSVQRYEREKSTCEATRREAWAIGDRTTRATMSVLAEVKLPATPQPSQAGKTPITNAIRRVI